MESSTSSKILDLYIYSHCLCYICTYAVLDNANIFFYRLNKNVNCFGNLNSMKNACGIRHQTRAKSLTRKWWKLITNGHWLLRVEVWTDSTKEKLIIRQFAGPTVLSVPFDLSWSDEKSMKWNLRSLFFWHELDWSQWIYWHRNKMWQNSSFNSIFAAESSRTFMINLHNT